MLIRNRESFIEILCPAKLNLFLEVKGKRPDGYHEIETVMQTVSIYDRLLIESSPPGQQASAPEDAPGTRLVCDDAAVPSGAGNIVCRAVEQMRRATGIDAGITIHLEKNIPAGAGLAGGSSDAAGTIAGLNELWQVGLPKARLAEIGAAVGSDVPFFIFGGTALCRGRGEKITPLPASAGCHFVVVWPGFELSTRDIYQKLDLSLTDHGENGNILEDYLGRGRSAQAARPAKEMARCFFNRLEQTALAACPELADAKRVMTEEGLLGVTMTGSGSAFFGLCDRKEVALQKEKELSASGIGLVFACESTHN